MKNIVLKTCLTALILSVASLADAVIVSVDSKNQAFQGTGIIVTAGDTINISTSGVITWGCPQCKIDANGIVPNTGEPMSLNPSSADFLVEGTRIFSLVGRIGASTQVTEGAPSLGAGFVGASYSQTANASGELFLAFNDDSYPDNIGTWQANITTVEPSPFKSHAAISGGSINIAAGSTVNGDLAAQAAVVIGANAEIVHNIYAGAAVLTARSPNCRESDGRHHLLGGLGSKGSRHGSSNSRHNSATLLAALNEATTGNRCLGYRSHTASDKLLEQPHRAEREQRGATCKA